MILGIYQKNPKALIQKDTGTPVLTAALFTIAKTWKQPNCLSTDDWLKKYAVYMCVYMCMYAYTCVHAQLCPTLCDPMDCSLPRSSVHGIFQAKIFLLQGIFPTTQGLNLLLLYLLLWQVDSLPTAPPTVRVCVYIYVCIMYIHTQWHITQSLKKE